jgi:uncharacterized protein (DUF58 family)
MQNHNFKALQIKARQEVYRLLSGTNLSKLHGEGYDFSELREYQIGDDIRKINWTISAKLGKPYIKELHANRELLVVVATLCDGSLYFGVDNQKQIKITEISTILAYATQQQGDLFSGFNYTQNKTHITPPTKQLYHIEQFSKNLFNSKLLGTKLNYQKAIDNLFKRISKPSLLFLVSDFLNEVDLSLLAQKHEVIAIVVRNRTEENPKKLGEVNLSSPTHNLNLDTFFGQKSIHKYKEKLMKHDKRLKEHFGAYGVRYIKIFTDEEVVGKLMRLLY